MKKLIVFLAACAGAVGTFFWLRSGGDLGQMKGVTQRALRKTEDELADLDGRDAPYAPAHIAGA